MQMLFALALFVLQDDPLRPLTSVAKEFNRGMAEFVKGSDVAKAFPAWTTKARNENQLREMLADAQATSVENFGFVIRLIFCKDGNAVYQVVAFVYAGEDEVLLENIGGSKCAALEPPEYGKPAADFKGASEGIAQASQGLRRALAGDGWKKLRWAGEKQKALLPDSDKHEIEGDGASGKKAIEGVAVEVARLADHELRIDMQAQVFVARDAKGQPAGVMESEFVTPAKGPMEFTLGRLKR